MARNWTEALVGLWVLLSPWLFGFSDISLMKWSNIVAGIVIILINAWAIFGEEKPPSVPETPGQK